MLKKRFNSDHRGLINNYIGQYKSIYENEYGVLPSWVKHYYPCDEYKYSYHNNRLIDVAGRFDLSPETHANPDSIVFTAQPLDDNYHIGTPDGSRAPIGHDGNNQFECFNNQDWIVVSCAKADANGNFEFTLGDRSFSNVLDQPVLKLQPYYMAIDFANGLSAPWGFLQTPFYAPLKNRVQGQDYLIAWLKRGSVLEHWIDGALVGTVDADLMIQSFGRDFGSQIEESYNQLSVMRPASGIRLGHSSHGDISTKLLSSNTEYNYDHFSIVNGGLEVEIAASFTGSGGNGDLDAHTQYASLLIGSWDVGQMPSDISGLCNWLKTEWLSGRKRTDYEFL